MGGLPGPVSGVVLSYTNVNVAIPEETQIVTVTVITAHGERITQISRETGAVVGGSNVPKTD